MRYYFAPMEGLTDSIYRRLHHKYFPGVDRYYMPFISPTIHRSLTHREDRELPLADSVPFTAVPQILTKVPEDFLWAAQVCRDRGYEEVNLNVGCPSGTVVSKGKGSGMLADPGYRRIVPKICTYVPQSSVFGMLLEREEPHTIIKSRQVGLLQHEPYSWEVMGGDFVREERLTADSRFLDRTFKTWLADMSTAERNEFFDTVFELLMTEDAHRPWDILRPQNLRAYFVNLKSDSNARRVIASELAHLIRSAKSVQKLEDPK